jgi:hypothetical protein
MSSIAEIERAVASLPREEFSKFARWFDEQRNLKWDQQIEADSNSGALNFLRDELREDIAKGHARPTDELCVLL